MKHLKLIGVLLIAIVVSGCATFTETDENYKQSLAGDNDTFEHCIENNRNDVKIFVDEKMVAEVSHAASGCERQDVLHGGKYLTQTASSLGVAAIGLVSTIGAQAINDSTIRKTTRSRNETAVLIADLERLTDASRDEVLLQAISGEVTPTEDEVAADEVAIENEDIISQIQDLVGIDDEVLVE